MKNFIFLILVFTTFSNCAQLQAQSRLEEYQRLLDPAVGTATKEDVIGYAGIPTKTFKMGDSEVWEYHRSFGSRGTGVYHGYGIASGRSHEVYDNITLVFDSKGILKNWKTYVQR